MKDLAMSPPAGDASGTTQLKKGTRIFVFAQLGFFTMLTMGAVMELALALELIQLPDEVNAVLRQWHKPPFVEGWVLLSNALTLLIAPSLALAGIAFLRSRRGIIMAKRLTLALLGVLLLGQAVMVSFVYPQMELAVLLPALMGAAGAIVFAGFLLRFWTRKSTEYMWETSLPAGKCIRRLAENAAQTRYNQALTWRDCWQPSCICCRS